MNVKDNMWLSFTYTEHSFVHPTDVVFYIHGTFICSSFTCCLLHSVKDNMCRMNKSMSRVCKRQHVKDEQMNVPCM
jgi:hypothetical protein